MRMQSHLKAACRVLSASLLLLSVSFHPVIGQNDVSTQVSQAIRLISLEPQVVRKEFRKLGPSAFPHILRAIGSDSGLDPIKKAFLIDVIGRSRAKESARTLIALLSDSDPYVRGLAASYFGRRKDKTAIAQLVRLLDDKGIYATRTRTDPVSEEPILVRDKAIEALEAITRSKMKPEATGDEQAKAWQQWWLKHQQKSGQKRPQG